MRVVTADEIDRVLDLSGADRGVARGASAPTSRSPLRHTHMIPQPARQRSEVSADAGLDQLGRAPRRLQDRHASIRTIAKLDKPSVYRQLPADVRRHRRAARRDGRHRAHRLAHRLRLGARGVLSRARGCRASRDDRRGRARAASGARACERAADQARHASGTARAAAPCRLAFALSVGGHRGRGRRRSRSRGARGRHRVLRDALGDAAGARQVAQERRASRPGRRLHAEDARVGRRCDQARARLCRYPRRRAEGGAATSCSR